MSLQPRLEDVLHLLAWNGYVEEVRQAVYVSKETYTDERIWFPFLIQHGYGPKKKTLPQIIAEHCTHVESPHTRKLVPKKDGMLIYKPDKQWITRMAEIQQMAVNSYHTKIFDKALRITDADGSSALIAACKTNSPKIVSYLLKKGHDYNQEDNLGATPSYYAYNSKFGQRAWSSLLKNSKFESKYRQPRRVYVAPIVPVVPVVAHHIYQFNNYHNLIFNLNYDDEPEPPKKKLKRSEYKKQFGRR
jgi:hypothetical protein